MRFLLVGLLCLSAMAQDNFQTVQVPSSTTPVTFDVKDHNVGRGDPTKFDLRSNWDPTLVFNPSVGYKEAFAVTAGTDGIAYDLRNINSALPLSRQWILGGTDVTSSNNKTSFSVRGGDTFGNAIVGIEPGGNYKILTATYTPTPGFVGNDTAVFTFTSNGNTVATTTVTFNIPNRAPVIALQASPLKLAPGGTVAFIATASDPDGQPLTITFNYGDGSTGTESFRTYSTPGIYNVVVSAFDGFDTTTANISVEVVGDPARAPVPRFTTSDVVGFVGLPLAFDASFTTDPQNNIVAYAWSFGDGSASGAGQVISRTYTAEGSYLVTLTVVDGEGIQAQTARAIEILPAELIGTFNTGMDFKTVFDRTKPNKDSLTFHATVNIGDAQAGNGTPVSLVIAGQAFSAQLDRKLRSTVTGTPRQVWKVRFGVRHQAAGQVDVTLTIKNANLGLGFNQLGALADVDDLVEITVPVALTVGSKTFEIPIDASFKFNKAGTRAKGSGESE